MKHLILILALSVCVLNGKAQNRTFELLDPGLGRSLLLDRGNGENYWIKEQRFNFDSTYIHVMEGDMDMNLEHIGGYIGLAPLSWMNDATIVDDDIIIGGANLGFSTIPYVLRMNNSGELEWSYFFNNFTSGNKQIHSTFSYGDKLDLFTWSDNTRFHYYMINGFVDGTFPSALKVDAPAETEIRVDDATATGLDRDYMVICQADTANSFSKFLIVMHIDSSGVQSARMHDHDTSMISELESSSWLEPTSDGHWVYGALFNSEGTGLQYRMVKMQMNGEVIWSKAFFESGERLVLGVPHTTDDGGLIFFASRSTDFFMIKIDVDGNVLWSQQYAQNLSANVPFGRFMKNDLGQLYAYNNSAITELDEDINVCDMEAHSGITTVDEPFISQPVTSVSSTIEPSVAEMPTSPRTGDFDTQLDCQYVGLEEEAMPLVDIYPNPVSESLTVDLRSVQDAVRIQVISVDGQIDKELKTESGQEVQIDVASLIKGTYILNVLGEEFQAQSIFIKH